jgi:hypothetical protein
MLCLSYYCLFLLFNRTGEKYRPGREKGAGTGGRNEPNNLCTCEKKNNKIKQKKLYGTTVDLE